MHITCSKHRCSTHHQSVWKRDTVRCTQRHSTTTSTKRRDWQLVTAHHTAACGGKQPVAKPMAACSTLNTTVAYRAECGRWQPTRAATGTHVPCVNTTVMLEIAVLGGCDHRCCHDAVRGPVHPSHCVAVGGNETPTTLWLQLRRGCWAAGMGGFLGAWAGRQRNSSPGTGCRLLLCLLARQGWVGDG